MEEKNKVVEFLIEKNKCFNNADELGFLQGTFDFNKMQVIQNAGSVYGVFIKIGKDDLDKLPKKYDKNAYKIDDDYYVLYWGKDVHPSNRISKHLKANILTGSLHLNKKTELHNYELIWGCIIVNKYGEFEEYLHKNFKPILGSSFAGKSLKNIKVEN